MDKLTLLLLMLLLLIAGAGTILFVRERYASMLYPALLLIFFPAPNIQLFGKDALTTGSICIFFMFACYLFVAVRKGQLVRDTYDGMVYLLLLCGLISTVVAVKTGDIRGDEIGPAVRQYVTFVSALLFFLLIKNFPYTHRENFPEKVLDFMLVLISVHVVIAIILKLNPGIDALLQTFYARDQEALFSEGGIARGRSILFSPEQFGEILAALSPIVIYRTLHRKSWLWYACLALFAIGLVLSSTRSGIILAGVGVIVSMTYYLRDNFLKVSAVAGASVAILLIVMFYAPSWLGEVSERFAVAKHTYASTGGNLVSVMNRDKFPEIWQEVMRSLSPFGHSLFRVDYHNLFLTTFHQLGYIGSLLFFWVLLYPLALLVKAWMRGGAANRGMIFCCMLAMVLFMTNEIKFEFTRLAGYQQVCWALFGLFYLIARDSLQQRRAVRHG